MTTTEPTPEAVEALAAVIDPKAFDPDQPKSTRQVAVLQWAARRHMAMEAASKVLAAGYVKMPTTCPDDSDMCDWLIQRERNEVERLKSDLTRFADGITALSEDLHPHPLIRKIVGPSLDVLATEARAIRDYDPTGATIAFAAEDDEHIDDTDLCEHGLRFGCADCKPELHRLMSNPPVWGDGS